MTKLAVALGFLILNVYIYYYLAREAVVPNRPETFFTFPLQIGEWSCPRNEPLDPAVRSNLGATDTLLCQYVNGERAQTVGLYIGYHATQVREEGGGSAENSIHPPAHCLPGSGWDIIQSDTVPIPVATVSNPNARAKRLIIARGKDRQLVYYWYQMQGRSIAEDWQKILYVGYGRATTGRTDGALVRFTMPFERDAEPAEEAFREFADQVLPLLPRFVPS